MKSYRIERFGAPLAAHEAETPRPQGTEVLLRVLAAGVCHSDLHIQDGYFDLGGGKRVDLGRSVPLPLAPGHEVAGEVIALGPEVDPARDGIALGDRRLVYSWIGCGDCALCRTGEEHLCLHPRAVGINRNGGYSDHVLVPHSRYLLDFGDIPVEEACTYPCSGLTAYGALRKVAPLAVDDTLLVIGAGGVGLAGVRIAQAVTGVPAVVAEIDPAKRDAALAAGAAWVLDPAAEGAARSLVKTTGGVAAAIDFVGSAESARFGFDVLRKGGTLVVVGLLGGALALPVPHFPLRVVTVRGSYVGSLEDMKALLDIARGGGAAPVRVERRRLDEAEKTLQDLRAGRVIGRAVLVP